MRSSQAHSARFHRHLHTALVITLFGLLAGALGPDIARAQTDAQESFIGSWTGTFEIRPGVEAHPVFHIERLEADSASAPLLIPKIDDTIKLDGRPQEVAWGEARTLSPVQHSPNFGAEPTEKTEFLIGYTDEYLYAACRCSDQGPLSTPSFKRDYFTTDTDGFALLLDTFNDNENALGFITTPTGLRTDFAIFNDASGRLPFDLSWNTFWEAEAQQTSEGWSAEIRIPISSLRFDTRNGQVVMGLSVLRLVARKPEFSTFPAIPPKWGSGVNTSPRRPGTFYLKTSSRSRLSE